MSPRSYAPPPINASAPPSDPILRVVGGSEPPDKMASGDRALVVYTNLDKSLEERVRRVAKNWLGAGVGRTETELVDGEHSTIILGLSPSQAEVLQERMSEAGIECEVMGEDDVIARTGWSRGNILYGVRETLKIVIPAGVLLVVILVLGADFLEPLFGAWVKDLQSFLMSPFKDFISPS